MVEEGEGGGKKFEFERQVEKKKDKIDLPGYHPFDPRTHTLSKNQHEWLTEFNKVMGKMEGERKGEEEARKGELEKEEREEEEKQKEWWGDEKGRERDSGLEEEKKQEMEMEQREREELVKEVVKGGGGRKELEELQKELERELREAGGGGIGVEGGGMEGVDEDLSLEDLKGL